jgi:hypothetical protein
MLFCAVRVIRNSPVAGRQIAIQAPPAVCILRRTSGRWLCHRPDVFGQIKCGLFRRPSGTASFRKPWTNSESDALTVRTIDLSPLRPPPRSWASFDPLREYAGEVALIGKARGQRDLA